jgi:filamentous hemagglutinin family protein
MVNTTDSWKVRGFVSDVSDSRFNIGTLAVNLTSQTEILCQQGFTNGELVEIMMAPDLDYQSGLSIDTLQSIECINLNQLIEQTLLVPAVVQGFISQTQGNKFQLDDIKVITSNQTLFKNGERGFIDTAVNVEIQGTFDTEKSELQADEVRFLDHRIEVTFPIEPEDITLNESINIHGVTFFITPQTKDNANILTNGLNSASQIQIQGYIDSNGKAYLSKVLNKGAVNYNKISLRGDIHSLYNPLFELLNFTIDSSDSLIINHAMGVIDVDMFFSLVTVGFQLEIKNAQYDIDLDQISGGKISIKQTPTGAPTLNTREIIGSGIIRGFGTATISSTVDLLFKSTF